MLARANDQIDAALRDGELVCIFPARAHHRQRRSVPVSAWRAAHRRTHAGAGLPDGIAADSGGRSFHVTAVAAFSRPIESRLRRGVRSRIEIAVGASIAAQDVTPALLEARVRDLRGEER